MNIKLYSVNAFTAHDRGGNPAGVVLNANRLSEQQMLSIAKQIGYSETAFVSNSSKATHRVRFFTPTEEVDLCGHATIATWSLMQQQALHSPGTYSQETLAGVLKVHISENGLIFMEQAKPQFFESIAKGDASPLLGISESDIHSKITPQIVSTGLRDLIVGVQNTSVLDALNPDFDAMVTFSRQHDITGLHVLGLLENDDSIASARNFAPAVGIPEESATGTSNGGLLCYLRRNELLQEQLVYRIEQGKSMGKLSYIYGKFEGDTVWIGGRATVTGQLEDMKGKLRKELAK